MHFLAVAKDNTGAPRLVAAGSIEWLVAAPVGLCRREAELEYRSDGWGYGWIRMDMGIWIRIRRGQIHQQ